MIKQKQRHCLKKKCDIQYLEDCASVQSVGGWRGWLLDKMVVSKLMVFAPTVAWLILSH
jgi:hypothetical protein